MAITKEPKKTYYVRDFPLHKEIITNGRKSRQTFGSGDSVELTDAEAIRYKHLIETEEQVKSRQGVKK